MKDHGLLVRVLEEMLIMAKHYEQINVQLDDEDHPQRFMYDTAQQSTKALLQDRMNMLENII